MDSSLTIYGRVVNPSGFGVEEVNVSIKGILLENETLTDNAGFFKFEEVNTGNFVLTPSKEPWIFGPSSMSITIDNSDSYIGEFIGSTNPVITGKVITQNNITVAGVTLDVQYGEKHESVITNIYGFYNFVPKTKNTTCIITPLKENPEYDFSPEYHEITFTDSVIVRNFRYLGNKLYTISGLVTDIFGEGIRINIIWYKDDYFYTMLVPDSNGRFSIQNILPGTYKIDFESAFYDLDLKSTIVSITNKDITIPPITGRYIGPTRYEISGKVVDDENNGTTGVSVNICNEHNINMTKITDLNGIYNFKQTFFTEIDEKTGKQSFSIKPHKNGFTFDPDSTIVILTWNEGIREDKITILDFIGHDHTVLNASNYFKMETGTTWTYKRTEDDKEPYDYSVKVVETISHGGHMYHRLSEPGHWKYTDFRIEDNNVYAFSDDKNVLFLKFGVVPGTRWEMGVIAGTYTRTGTFIGTETVDTPAGIFENCAHFEMKVVYGETSYDSYNLWYAPGAGLVRSVKIVENYGRRLEYVVDELKSYEIP